MDKVQILELIKTKIKEHQVEIEGSENMLKRTRKHLKDDLQPEEIRKMLVLKDKVTFHKAAVLALHDLSMDIEKI